MSGEPPKSTPEAAPEKETPGEPSIYGGQWGESGKQKPDERGQVDRPRPIEAPKESE
ncbi:hypothetical protein [Phenylobacterium hankyongense]|uniref:hypothetical protein n=1 Tax=Phenylobacterium hankyongense TaxID=1813876 RepID=UPI0014036952|nr:hypothetical protein [Phenylobacterium hankyongense]